MNQPKSRLYIGFLYDDTLDSSDGVAQQVKTLGSWLSSRGHDVSYLVGETKMRRFGGGKVYSLAKNKAVTFNGNRLSIPILTDRQKIKKVLAGRRFDVLHVQVPYSPLMSQAVINRADSSTAIVGTFHIYPSTFLAEVGARILRLLLGASLKRFDQIVSVSQPAADFAKRAFGIRTDILPNVVDVAKFSHATEKNSGGESYHIVFLGRLVKRKGCLSLLKAFALLKKTVPDIRLTVAGDGPQRPALERYVGQQKLGSSVNFTGFIKEKDKPRLLAGADIACFPSLYGESFGIVLIEAMAAGAKVVLAGQNPGYASVLSGQEELLIDPTNTEQFAARIGKLLRNEQLAEKLHGWQLAEVKKYDVATVGPEIEAIYHRAIAKAAKSRHN
ncbi:glycosyltransferase family 4 protein [Candidatus Saccharibacteria bacterium]|nr:glycosyltransferase family 4 protein [Candidatus Saccharibacteria bacterium]